MEFQFCHGSGNMAFTVGCGDAISSRLLLVTDCDISGRDAVHVIDVVSGTHVGYMAAPGTIMNPRGVATQNSLAAVSCYTSVRLFEGSGATWAAVRTIAVAIAGFGVSADGLRLVVAELHHRRLSIFCAKDGALLRHMALPGDVYPFNNIEECVISDGDGSRAGWVMCREGGLVAIADNENANGTDVVAERRKLYFHLFGLTTLPGVGLVVRFAKGLQFFATPDAIAMASMSSCKVAWMVAVCRRGLL
jgi:hypothetical protein